MIGFEKINTETDMSIGPSADRSLIGEEPQPGAERGRDDSSDPVPVRFPVLAAVAMPRSVAAWVACDTATVGVSPFGRGHPGTQQFSF